MNLKDLAKRWLSDVAAFSRFVTRRPLRRYQLEIARAVVDSVLHQKGLTFAVMFPRQSGKNETQAQLEAYLLNLFQRLPGAQIVKASPTFKPQTVNSLMRLETMLDNPWNASQWQHEQGYIVKLGRARALFFSAEPSASVVGATASVLLECDEAQDVDAAKWQKDFVPMVASTNATRVLWGTAWTSQTLLANTIRQLRKLEQLDGVKRVFTVTVDQVAQEVPNYGAFVAGEVARLGRQHPLIKTQFFLEEIDAQGGLFTETRRLAMAGEHLRHEQPQPGFTYAFLVDVGGADEEQLAGAATLDLGLGTSDIEGGKRDSTALTIVIVDPSTLADPVLHAPTYRVARRVIWTNTPQPALYGQIKALADAWRPARLIIDATGLGQGLAAFLARLLPERVIPFVFTSSSKSKLGWDFLTLIDAGRFRDYVSGDDLRAVFYAQLIACQYEVVPGPAKLLRWAVPAGARDHSRPGAPFLHDDLLFSAALATLLDTVTWSAGGSGFVPGRDPLAADKGY